MLIPTEATEWRIITTVGIKYHKYWIEARKEFFENKLSKEIQGKYEGKWLRIMHYFKRDDQTSHINNKN